MPARIAGTVAGWALCHGQLPLAACVLAGFHLCLRTGEVLGINRALVQFDRDGKGVISLPWTKTAAQKGARENITIDDQYVGVGMHRQLSIDPGGKLWPGSLPAFHSAFKEALSAVGCSHLKLSPYSLRRGGATHEFMQSADLARVMLRGRWSSARTAKIYIEDGAAVLAEMNYPRSTAKALDYWCQHFVQKSESIFG